MMQKQKLPTTCPKCKGALSPISVLITDWPYVHTDLKLRCRKCNQEFMFGIPLDRLAGCNLQIYDSNPLAILQQVNGMEHPKCPFHNTRMRMTKIFGDKVNAPLHVQFKCKSCYYLEHVKL